jgi:hypothetical protein
MSVDIYDGYRRRDPEQGRPATRRPQLECALHHWKHRSFLQRKHSQTRWSEPLQKELPLKESANYEECCTALRTPSSNLNPDKVAEVIMHQICLHSRCQALTDVMSSARIIFGGMNINITMDWDAAMSICGTNNATNIGT